MLFCPALIIRVQTQPFFQVCGGGGGGEACVSVKSTTIFYAFKFLILFGAVSGG